MAVERLREQLPAVGGSRKEGRTCGFSVRNKGLGTGERASASCSCGSGVVREAAAKDDTGLWPEASGSCHCPGCSLRWGSTCQESAVQRFKTGRTGRMGARALTFVEERDKQWTEVTPWKPGWARQVRPET